MDGPVGFLAFPGTVGARAALFAPLGGWFAAHGALLVGSFGGLHRVGLSGVGFRARGISWRA